MLIIKIFCSLLLLFICLEFYAVFKHLYATGQKYGTLVIKVKNKIKN